jgi:dTDP-4-dehydrorhamnose reductase
MRWLVTGATGKLGGYLIRELTARRVEVTAWTEARAGVLFGVPLRPVPLQDKDRVTKMFHEAVPDVVLHAGALSQIADCHRQPARAEAVNTAASGLLAELAAGCGARLVLISTDLVFDGEAAPYAEDEPRRRPSDSCCGISVTSSCA